MPSVDSEECSSPGVNEGVGKSPSRNGRVTDAVRRVNDTGPGGATVFGQSAPATAMRSVFPGVHWYAQASSTTSTCTSRPGTNGDGSPCTPSRNARSSVPRETSADVPSGNTSHSLTEIDAAGSVAHMRALKTGCPTTALGGGSTSQVRERSSSSRWSPDNPHGRWPAQSIQAAVPTSGETVSDAGAIRSRVASLTGGTDGS